MQELTITIRKMEPADAGAMHEIEEQCFSQPWSEKAFSDSCQDTKYLFLVASCEDGVVGYVGSVISLDEADITNVAVAPDYRRRGIAGNLLQTLKRLLRAQDISQVFLEVRQSNEPAINLYKGLLFEAIGLRKNFYQFPREDAILMKASLMDED